VHRLIQALVRDELDGEEKLKNRTDVHRLLIGLSSAAPRVGQLGALRQSARTRRAFAGTAEPDPKVRAFVLDMARSCSR